ncbi:MAG: anion permease [Desulfobulbus sp.]|jgi:anion transporter|uniref:DASS family sodium-coupled anion symporter n=1 Tax=Desulfobulbus sp. TaxID=895 RepID=UPI00283B52DD|nr:DASS family sodium-coupled anion symporter [Desulfobulbus sp.]MDR2551371.1 anion permease [Desulfobulbus sp.]
MNSRSLKGIIAILAVIAMYLLPTLLGASPMPGGRALFAVGVPPGLHPEAWLYFSIFIGVVVGLILEPLPAALVSFIGVVAAAFLRVGAIPGHDGGISVKEALTWGLSGFSDSTVWLIFVAFMFAMGYEKTGLGKRIALILVKYLGKNSLGLGYAVALSDCALAPFMPSNTARSGGTLFPIIRNIPAMFGSFPDKEPRKLGAYLVWVALASTCVTSSLFYTGLAPNILAGGILNSNGIAFTWTDWFLTMAPVGIPLLLLVPLLTYFLYPPGLKKAPDAPVWARKELEKMGAMSRRECIMLALAFFALVLWIWGSHLADGTETALIVFMLMPLLGVVSWDDILGNKSAWNVLIWFGTLVTLAEGLNHVGFLAWFAHGSASFVRGYSPEKITLILLVIFFLSHYLFASVTAHVTALLGLFVTTANGIPGVDAHQTALLLAMSLGLMGILTPYGAGPSPIWYGAGYISPKAFWILGFLFGMLYLAFFLVIGVPWMRLLHPTAA